MKNIQIVLLEWMGYPLYRKKLLRDKHINCGLGRLLDNFEKYSPGIDFECMVVFNKCDTQPSGWLSKIANNSLLRPLFFNSPLTNDKRKYDDLLARYPFVSQHFYRDNINQDIGAYDFFYRHLREKNYTGDVVFINSSTRGPSQENWLKKYHILYRKHAKTGFLGISLNSHNTSVDNCPFSPHVQSFFIYTSMEVLNDVFPNGLIDNSELDKGQLINQGEISMSKKVLDKQWAICCSTFPDFLYKSNDSWIIPEGDIRLNPEYQHLANLI